MRTDTATLHGVLLDQAGERPDAVHTVAVTGESFTYGDVVTRAQQWAEGYRRLGVEPGDHVVTIQLNTPDAFFGWLGLAWIGGVEAPLNVDYRGDMLVQALNLTRARIVVAEQQFAERLGEVAADVPDLETVVVLGGGTVPDLPFEVVTAGQFLDVGEPGVELPVPAPWDIAAVLFTSGTTGPAKGVRVPWGQLHATATAIFPIADLAPEDVIYNPGPNYHVGARAFPFLAALVGGRQVMAPFLSFTHLGEHVTEFGVTTGFPVPSWLGEPERPDDADRSLRNLLTPIHLPWLDEFKRRFGCRSFGSYNMTEVSLPVVQPDWDRSVVDESGRMSCGQVRPGYPGYEVRVVDEHDQPVPPGAVGELVARASAPWTMNAGYLHMPAETAAAWRNGWFRTGDAFVCDDEGNFFFVDRLKDCIRRHGENISSFEVEALVGGHPMVAEVAAVAVKQSEASGADEEVKVVVVLGPDSELTAGDLVEWLIPRMPRFMIPRFVEFVDALPKTPTGKVRKVDVRAAGVTARTWDRDAAGLVLPREP